MTHLVIGWATEKTDKGFNWSVTKTTPTYTPNENGHYGITEVVKSGFRPTRAQASGIAKRWTLFLRKGGQV